MKKNIISLILIIFCSCDFLAQEVNNIGMYSLDILNQKFHLNLTKENEPILIIIDDLEFICLEYTDMDNLPSILRLKLRYELVKIGSNKYNFVLKGASEYSGSFELSEVNGNMKLINLEYIKRDDYNSEVH